MSGWSILRMAETLKGCVASCGGPVERGVKGMDAHVGRSCFWTAGGCFPDMGLVPIGGGSGV